MTNREKKKITIGGIITAVILILIIVVSIAAEPMMVRFNNWRGFRVQEAHDQTDYATLRRVEDTARAMIATWEGDRDQWLLFRDRDDDHSRNVADAALLRANRSAATFNEFILENNFVWAYGVPDDISEALPRLGFGDAADDSQWTRR